MVTSTLTMHQAKLQQLKIPDGNAGWDTLGGISVQADLDSTTIYEITPRVVIGAPAGDGSTGARQAVGRAVVVPEQNYKSFNFRLWCFLCNTQLLHLQIPNNTVDAPVQSFIGDGVLGQPNICCKRFRLCYSISNSYCTRYAGNC